jgi:hypothetical protein
MWSNGDGTATTDQTDVRRPCADYTVWVIEGCGLGPTTSADIHDSDLGTFLSYADYLH